MTLLLILALTVAAFGFNRNINAENPKSMMPDDKQTAPLEFINDTIVEFDFENIMFEFPNFLNFDVLIRTNIDGLEFGEGELFTKYPASAFGSNVVTNEHIETLKGDVIMVANMLSLPLMKRKTLSKLKLTEDVLNQAFCKKPFCLFQPNFKCS